MTKTNSKLGICISKSEMKNLMGGQNGWSGGYYCLTDPYRRRHLTCPSPIVCPAGCGYMQGFSTTTTLN